MRAEKCTIYVQQACVYTGSPPLSFLDELFRKTHENTKGAQKRGVANDLCVCVVVHCALEPPKRESNHRKLPVPCAPAPTSAIHRGLRGAGVLTVDTVTRRTEGWGPSGVDMKNPRSPTKCATKMGLSQCQPVAQVTWSMLVAMTQFLMVQFCSNVLQQKAFPPEPEPLSFSACHPTPPRHGLECSPSTRSPPPHGHLSLGLRTLDPGICS